MASPSRGGLSASLDTRGLRPIHEPKDNLLSEPIHGLTDPTEISGGICDSVPEDKDDDDDDDVSTLAMGSALGDPDHGRSGASRVSPHRTSEVASSREGMAHYPLPEHGSPTRSELDFDAESDDTASSLATTSSGQLVEKPLPTPSEDMPPSDASDSGLAEAEEERVSSPTDSGQSTPSYAVSMPEAATHGAPAARSSPAHYSSPANRTPRGAWQPSLNGGDATQTSTSLAQRDSSTARLHRPSVISSASPPINNVLQGGIGAQPESTPRSVRSGPRKRMSIGYVISSPGTKSVDSSGRPSSATGVSSPVSPSPSRYAPHLQRTASGSAKGRIALLRSFSQDEYSSSPSKSLPCTPQADVADSLDSASQSSTGPSPASPEIGSSGQITTIMDLSKNLLADIARRERRVGELKFELQKEECELQGLRRQWQMSVTRDLATQARSEEAQASEKRQSEAAEKLASLRAPRRRSIAPKPARDDKGQAGAQSPPETTIESQPRHSSFESDLRADLPQLPTGVTDALRGFSARLPTGLGSQFNSILEGLSAVGGAPSASPLPTPGTSSRPLTGTGLAALSEEGEPDVEAVGSAARLDDGARKGAPASADAKIRTTNVGGAETSSIPNAQSQRTLASRRAGTSGESTTVQGALPHEPSASIPPAARKQKTGAGPQTAIADDVASSGGSWTTQWSKRLRDAAARAERALGEAMTLEGISPASPAPPSESRRRLSTSSSATSPGLETSGHSARQRSPELSHGWASDRKGSSASTASKGSGAYAAPYTSSNWAEEANAKEKSALAELELGWLTNMVTGAGYKSSPSSSKGQAGRPSASRSPPAMVEQGSQPHKLSPKTLLALADGDGLVPEDLISHREQPSAQQEDERWPTADQTSGVSLLD
ncbi:unnamed protein product [Parajaminaea phylloscopi]